MVHFPVAPPCKDGQSIISWCADMVDVMGSTPFATWYGQQGKAEADYSFARLWEQAGGVGKRLKAEGFEKGDTVVTCYTFGMHAFVVFVGCLRVGIVPTFVYPPHPRTLKKSVGILDRIVERCGAKAILMDSTINVLRWKPFGPKWPTVPYIITDSGWNVFGGTGGDDDLIEPNIAPTDTVFLQYTSGSTGEPKGIAVTDGGLRANIQQNHYFMVESGLLDWAKSRDERPTVFSWAPQYHDLGLIIMLISPFLAGWRGHYCSPLTFIVNPTRWLSLMSKYRCHLSMAPDFAFALAARKYKENPASNMDLSSLCQLCSGGEPVSQRSVLAFQEVFRPLGLRKDWFTQCYGLAESVCSVSYSRGLVMRLKRGQNASCIGPADYDYGYGKVLLRVVDPNSLCEVPEGTQGELWVCSPSVSPGYLERTDEENADMFRAHLNVNGVGSEDHQRTFFRTGDLAFLEHGRVFICGRIKDMIIFHGENYFPQDLEDTAQRAGSETIRPGCVAAFICNADSGDLVIVFEIRKGAIKEASEVCEQVYSSVYKETMLKARRVVAVHEKTIPKTTSGKIQRNKTRLALRAGKLEVVHDAIFGKVEYEPEVEEMKAPPVVNSELLEVQKPKVCIVGAGMSGLVSAKTFLESGFDVTVFESRETLGGVWSPDAQYYSATTQVGEGGYEFFDMVNVGGGHTTKAQNYDYAHHYATENGVLPCCHFGVEVLNVWYDDDHDWNVATRSGISEELHKFKFVVVSAGIYSNPKAPDWSQWPGKADFLGEIIHSSELQSDQQLSGKHVLVIGGGRSSIDVICSAVEAGAKCINHVWQTHLTMGYKSDFMDIIKCCRILGEVIPYNDLECNQQRIDYMQSLFEKMYTEWGLPEHMFPEKYLFAKCNVAITRDDYLDFYKSGAFTTERATVVSFKGPSSVVLSTDTIVDADIIILATGYELSIPFLDESIQREIGIKPLKPDGDKVLRLYRGVLPAQDHKNLAFVGYIQGLFDLPLYQTQANWVAGLFSGQFDLPEPKQRDYDVNQALSFMEQFNKYSDGTSVGGWQFQYMKILLDDMGISFDLNRAMSHDTVSEFRADVCKHLEDFTLTRSAIARARNYSYAQPTVEHQIPSPHSAKISKEGFECPLPKFLAEVKCTCQTKGTQVFASWFHENGKEVKVVTFLSVWEQAQALSKCMRHEWGLSQGDRVILIYFPGIHILPILLGCFLSGVVPTLVHPPNPCSLKESIGYWLKLVQNFRPSLGLMDSSAIQAVNSAWLEGLSTKGLPRFVVADDEHLLKWHKKYESLPFEALDVTEDDLAFVQYNSGGSTCHLRGVMVTYKALQINIDMIYEGLYDTFMTRQGYMPGNLRCFNWLPHYHEMGLIQFLMPLHKGWQIGVMSPRTFLQKPLLWLELMSSHGTQYTFAPDFAYALCCEKFREVVGSGANPPINLKKLLATGIGAEPIRLSTLKLFTKTFRPLGFRNDAFSPLYGLAENVVMISYMKEIRISCTTSKHSCIAVGSRESFPQGFDIKVVDLESFQELPDSQEGEIWVHSCCASPGYFGQKERSLQVCHATLNDLENNLSYLRTGDLGYFESGNLFITGRLEEVIVSDDRNFYPSEIEDVAQNAAPSDVRPGCIAAFSLDDSVQDGQLCIVFEIWRESEPKAVNVASTVRDAVSQECGLSPVRVIAIQQKTVPKTTSGIVHRFFTREKLQMGQLFVVGESTVDTDSHRTTSSKVSRQLPDGVITEWKETQAERQDQILQVISSEVLHMLPPSDKVEPHDMANMSIFDASLNFVELGILQKSISKIVGLAAPLGTGALLDGLTFHELGVRIERLRFPGDGDKNDEEKGHTAVQSMKVKQANVRQVRKRENMEQISRLQKLTNNKPSRYEYCAQLPMISEKRLPMVNILIVNVMGFFLAFLMTLSSLYIASIPVNWVRFALRSNAVVIALIPVCYIIFVGALLLWLWCIRVSLLPSPPMAGRYPIYGPTHLRCWILEVCLVATRYAFYPFSGTCVNTWLFRVMGANIGHDVKISPHPVFSSCFLTINDGATCDSVIHLQCHMFVSSVLVMAPVFIGCNVSMKDAAFVEPGTRMMSGSLLDLCSTIPMGWTAPTDTYMMGSPAQASKIIGSPSLRNSRGLRLIIAPLMPYLLAVPLFVQMSVFFSVLSLISSDSSLLAMRIQPFIWLAMLVSEYACTIGAACLTIVTKWCLVQRLRAGPQSYWRAMRLEAYELCAEVLFPLFRFLPLSLVGLFLYLLGAKVSRPLTFEEDGFVEDMRYLSLVKTCDLLKLGSGVFLGAGDYKQQLKDPLTNQLFLYDVGLPDGCFFGGHTYVGVGAQLEENVGVLDGSCVPPFSRVKKSRICVGNEGQYSMKMPQNAEDWKIVRSTSQQLLILLTDILKSAANLVPVVTLKMIWFQVYQLLMGHLDPSMSIAGVYVSFVAASSLNAIFMIVLHNTVWDLPQPHSRDGEHRVYSSAYRSASYRAWLHNYSCVRMLNESILAYTGSSPISPFLLRLLRVGKIGKDFIVDSRGMELYELKYCVIGDNVCMNNHAALSPHTISFGHTLDLCILELGDRTTLFPSSGIFGATKLPNGAMLCSGCHPFRSQALQPGHEYNDTPCSSFKESFAVTNTGTKPSVRNRISDAAVEGTLKREDAIEVARSVLCDILDEDGSYPTSDPTIIENIEVELDSVQLMEYASRIMKKANCQFEAESLFEVNTVGEVADLLISHQVRWLIS